MALKLIKEVSTAEVTSITLGLVSGVILVSISDSFLTKPGLTILIPMLLGMGNDIDGSLAARLGSALHTGVVESKLSYSRELTNIVAASFFLSIIVTLYAGFLSYFISVIAGLETMVLSKLVFYALFGGFMSKLISIPTTTILSIFLFSRGIDPDSVMGPILTSYGDILTIGCLYIAITLGEIVFQTPVSDILTISVLIIVILFAINIIHRVSRGNEKSTYQVNKIIRESWLMHLIPLSYTAPAGLVISHFRSFFLTNPALLIMLPPLNGLAGDFGIIISSRLTTMLHMGRVEAKLRNLILLKEEWGLILFIGGISSIFLGTACYIFAFLMRLGNVRFEILLIISFISVILLILLELLISVIVSFISFTKGLDPDNIVIPITTDLGDTGGILFLIMSAIMLGLA